MWPPDYQEQLLRHYTINTDTIIEVEEHIKDIKVKEEDCMENESKDLHETNNHDIGLEENNIKDLVPGSVEVETETETLDVEPNLDVTRISRQYLEPPGLMSSSLVYLQSSNRRNSLLGNKHQTM